MNHNTNESHTPTQAAINTHTIRRTLPAASVVIAATVVAIFAWQAPANSASSETPHPSPAIDKDAVLAAQQAWGDALLSIAAAHREHGVEQARALAYFVGGDANFPNDSGFALKPWVGFSFKNAAVWIHGDTAITTGNVHLTDKQGNVTTVDKTWAFNRDDAGNLRIVLHHSSLPFTP